jgi:uncharacterized membrane protein YvbJ
MDFLNTEKHIVKCPHCGKDMLDHMSECPSCHEKIEHKYSPMDEVRLKRVKMITNVVGAIIAIGLIVWILIGRAAS